MKVTKLSVAAIAALAISTAAVAADAPTVYGVMNVEAGSFDSGATVGGQKMGAKTQSSRFGIKGAVDIDDTELKAIYQVELGFDTVGGIAKDLVARNTFLGVTGGFGTVVAGNHDHPSKLALYRSGAGVFAADTTAKLVQTELRSSPAVAYVSNFSEDITVAAAVVFDGNNTTTGGAQTNNQSIDASPAQEKKELMHFDVAAWGKAGDLKYGVGVIVLDDKDIKAAGGFKVDPIIQASVGYTLENLNFGLSLQKGNLHYGEVKRLLGDLGDNTTKGKKTYAYDKKDNDDISIILQANANFDGGYFAGVGVQMVQKGGKNLEWDHGTDTAKQAGSQKHSTDIGLIVGKKFNKTSKLYVAAKSFDKNANHGLAMTDAKNVKGAKAGTDIAVGLTVAF